MNTTLFGFIFWMLQCRFTWTSSHMIDCSRHLYELRDSSSYNDHFSMFQVLNSLQSFTEAAAITVLQVTSRGIWLQRSTVWVYFKLSFKTFLLITIKDNRGQWPIRDKLNPFQWRICNWHPTDALVFFKKNWANPGPFLFIFVFSKWHNYKLVKA